MSHHQLGLEEGLQGRWGRELYSVSCNGQHGDTGSCGRSRLFTMWGQGGVEVGTRPRLGSKYRNTPLSLCSITFPTAWPGCLPGVSSLPQVTAESLSLRNPCVEQAQLKRCNQSTFVFVCRCPVNIYSVGCLPQSLSGNCGRQATRQLSAHV